jgi:uncharacterized repeat protein (TIGR02543 family)
MKKLLLKSMLLLCALIVGSSSVWATDYVINNSNFTNINGGSGYAAYDGNHTINGITIASSNVMIQSNALQFKKSVNSNVYNTTAMPGNITKITLATATNFTIYVGTSANPSTTTVTSGSTISGGYTYFKIVNNTSNTATTSSITITYTSGLSVTYDANGATSGTVPTDATAYTSGASVTVKDNTGSLAKLGYTFDGWNTKQDGSGTDHAVGSTFSITANTTLYAKWLVKTITELSKTGTPTKTTYYDGESFDPTGLTVTASYTSGDPEDVTASIAWTPNPLTKGTTSVTGTFMGEEITVTGLTVTAVPGTEENPYSVAAVTTYITSGGTGQKYTRGIVSQAGTSVNSGKMTYYISDDGTTSNQLMIYSGKNLGNTNFKATTDLKVGDRVVVFGPVTYYNSTTPEYTTGNYVYSLSRDFTLTLDAMTNGSAAIQVNGVDQTPNVDGEVTVASGATVTLTATPASGYTFGKWTCTDDTWNNSTDNPLVFTMPFDDVVFGAEFADASVKYDIIVDDAVVGGTIEADVAKAKAGDEVTLTATPAANYVFGEWDVQDESSNAITVTNNKFTMPASDVTVTATFLPVYTVTYYIGGVEHSTTRVSGEELNLDVPSTGFAGWSTTNNASAPVFVANNAKVTSNLTLYAIFATSYIAEYQLVEADQTDWRGDYLIAYDDNTFADGREGGTSGMGAKDNYVDPSNKLSGKVVDLTWGDTYNVTLEAIDDTDLSKGYVLKTKDGLYNYQTQNKNGLVTTATKATAANYPITVTFNSASNIELELGGGAAGAIFQFNTDGYFRFYKDGGQSDVYLYKRTVIAEYSLDVYENVKLNASGYATFASKHALDFSDDSKFSAWQISDVTSSAITFSQIQGAVAASTGVLLKGTASSTISIPVVDSGDDISATNKLEGITTATVVSADTYYGLSGNKFVKVGAGTVKAGKALLPASEIPSTARDLTFVFEDEATGIENAVKSVETKDNNCYNLAGQRVAQPSKGLYIMNGKKVVIK